MRNMKVNIEYSLYEQIYHHETHDVKFDENDFRKDLKLSDPEYYLKDTNYTSFLPLDKIEFTKHTESRANSFLRLIINKYKDTNLNILFVTHGGIILNLIHKDDSEFPPMGGLLQYNYLEDTYKPINYVNHHS